MEKRHYFSKVVNYHINYLQRSNIRLKSFSIAVKPD